MSDSNLAISVENIYKVFRLGVKEEESDSLIQSMIAGIRNPLNNYKKYKSLYDFEDVDFDNPDSSENAENVLWALKGVSFDVKPGEVVGIIGRNGAGKSTLLKTLTRITPPSRGQIKIRGRVSSLLEVGTGFHPELTGRENVYLNGTILGMRKREVDKKFDEIVDFSGVERFLDTPVKRYSSGMRVRLAFAVAAHLEPEILIIDEVLAVGDASFQKKCLSKMEHVGKDGRTVLFVSHSMPAITRLCPRVVVLDQGKVLADGDAHEVVSAYLHSGLGSSSSREWTDVATQPGGEFGRLQAVRVLDESGNESGVANISKPIMIEVQYSVLQSGAMIMPHFHIFNEEGINVFSAYENDAKWRGKPRPVGDYKSRVTIPGNLMSEGMFYVGAGMVTLDPIIRQYYEPEAVAFQVIDKFSEGSARGEWVGNMGGAVRPLLEWNTEIIR